MRQLAHVFAALVLIAGCYYVFLAFTTPSNYNLVGANAIQATQVYTMAAYNALMAIAAFVFVGVIVLATRTDNENLETTLNSLHDELLDRIPKLPPSSSEVVDSPKSSENR